VCIRGSIGFPLCSFVSSVVNALCSPLEGYPGTQDHSITLVFRDETMLSLDIEPGFTIFAKYAGWKTGDVMPIKRWRPVRSRLFRELVQRNTRSRRVTERITVERESSHLPRASDTAHAL
jgi:hypothetical protein